MHKTITRLLSISLWAASMFIKLEEYQSRGETVRVYVYSYYWWVVAIAHQPEQLFTSFVPCLLFLVIDLLHFVLCFAVACICVWLFRRFSSIFRPPPNKALQRTEVGGGASSDLHA